MNNQESLINYDVWYESYDPSFIDISWKSRFPRKWIVFENIGNQFLQSVIKPINQYVEYLYPPPELVSITSDKIILRQNSHADIYLLVNEDGTFSNIDRPWIRQYYQSKHPEFGDNCFPGVYKAYVPWFIDLDIDVIFKSIDNAAFFVNKTNTNFVKINNNIDVIEPIMIPFRFKKTGAHMVDLGLGIIKAGSPMFDIEISSSAIIEERVRKFYANYQISPIHRSNI